MKQIAVAVGFVLAYAAEHPFYSPHFILGSGVRLIFLMLLPYRYWWALVIGELVPNSYVVFPCLDSFGFGFVAIRSIPPIVIAMPIVWLCKSKLGLFPTKRFVDIKTLFLCVVASSVAWTVYSYAALSVVHMKSGTFTPVPLMAAGYLVGNYLGILAVVPWALMVRFDLIDSHWRELVMRVVRSRLTLDSVALMAPAIVMLGWVSTTSHAEIKQVVLMSMFLPVAWLTLRHGWRAAAAGGTIAICSASMAFPYLSHGPEVTVTEVFLAITITLLFALGARISAQLMQEESDVRQAISTQKIARRTFQQSEQRMRNTAEALEYIAGTLSIANSRLLNHIRWSMPMIESEECYQQALKAHKQVARMAENLHPVAWRARGLPAALNGTIAKALDEAGIAYRCTISGRGFTMIHSAILHAIYRLACEAVVYISARLACNRIQLVLRGGETHGVRWMVLRVEGVLDDTAVADAVRCATERQRVAGKLGASGLDVGEIRDHARIFDGELHLRSCGERVRMTVLLRDVPKDVQKHQRASAPIRLWVR